MKAQTMMPYVDFDFAVSKADGLPDDTAITDIFFQIKSPKLECTLILNDSGSIVDISFWMNLDSNACVCRIRPFAPVILEAL